MWRNWQTRRLQVPVGLRPCRFDSYHPHSQPGFPRFLLLRFARSCAMRWMVSAIRREAMKLSAGAALLLVWCITAWAHGAARPEQTSVPPSFEEPLPARQPVTGSLIHHFRSLLLLPPAGCLPTISFNENSLHGPINGGGGAYEICAWGPGTRTNAFGTCCGVRCVR